MSWFMALVMSLLVLNAGAQSRLAQSSADGNWDRSQAWRNGNSPSNACGLTNDETVTVEHRITNNCDQLEVYGRSTVNVINQGKLIVNDLHLFGNASVMVAEGSELVVHGNLKVAGNAKLELNGKLTVFGRFSVEGSANACGSGVAHTYASVAGDNLCYDISIQPHKMLRMEASVAEGQVVRINWESESSAVQREYILERSANGMSFQEIMRVAPMQGKLKRHAVTDLPANIGTYYYRLTLVDEDGTVMARDLVAVSLFEDKNSLCQLEVHPNPCIPYCEARIINCPDGNFVTSILDGSGNVIEELIPIPDDGNQLKYHINKDNYLLPGIYIVNSANDKARLTKKVIIK